MVGQVDLLKFAADESHIRAGGRGTSEGKVAANIAEKKDEERTEDRAGGNY